MTQANQFNPMDPLNPSISARQLDRVGAIAQASANSLLVEGITGASGSASRITPLDSDLGWYKIITNETGGVYTLRRQMWSVADGEFADATDVSDIKGYEINEYHQIPHASTMPVFQGREEGELGGEVVVLFDWLQIQPTFMATITGWAVDGVGTNKWKYAWAERRKGATGGYSISWASVTNGRSGTTTVNPARNFIENMNTGAAAHVEGNGVIAANLTPALYTYAMMPCTTGNMVVMKLVPSNTVMEYWFQYETGVDGDCV